MHVCAAQDAGNLFNERIRENVDLELMMFSHFMIYDDFF